MNETISCPSCGQRVRVPANRGELQVKCPKCQLRWIWGAQPVKEQEPEGVSRFFKKVVNAFTGGSAQLELDLKSKPYIGQDVEIWINIKVGDLPVEAAGIYFELRAVESVTLPWGKVLSIDELAARRASPNLTSLGASFDHSETVFERRWKLGSEQTLAAHQTYRFKHRFELPAETKPSFEGKLIKHQWQMNSYLEVSTRNPKTGWHLLDVRHRGA